MTRGARKTTLMMRRPRLRMPTDSLSISARPPFLFRPRAIQSKYIGRSMRLLHNSNSNDVQVSRLLPDSSHDLIARNEAQYMLLSPTVDRTTESFCTKYTVEGVTHGWRRMESTCQIHLVEAAAGTRLMVDKIRAKWATLSRVRSCRSHRRASLKLPDQTSDLPPGRDGKRRLKADSTHETSQSSRRFGSV